MPPSRPVRGMEQLREKLGQGLLLYYSRINEDAFLSPKGDVKIDCIVYNTLARKAVRESIVEKLESGYGHYSIYRIKAATPVPAGEPNAS